MSEKCIAPANQVRLHKRMHLPCELIGLNGTCVTKEAKKVNKRVVLCGK